MNARLASAAQGLLKTSAMRGRMRTHDRDTARRRNAPPFSSSMTTGTSALALEMLLQYEGFEVWTAREW